MKSGKILLFLDNASIHYGVKIRDKILKFDIEILYNVPYESNFNPIGRVFRSIKTIIRSDKFSDLDEVKSSYFSAIRLLSEFDILKIRKHYYLLNVFHEFKKLMLILIVLFGLRSIKIHALFFPNIISIILAIVLHMICHYILPQLFDRLKND